MKIGIDIGTNNPTNDLTTCPEAAGAPAKHTGKELTPRKSRGRRLLAAFGRLLFATCLATCLQAAPASAQSFGGGNYLDRGWAPHVALNNSNHAVEVHEGMNGNLWFRNGWAGNNSVSWGGSQRYDNGSYPAVAMNNNNVVVEIHQDGAATEGLWYHVGHFTDNGIAWGPSIYSGAAGCFPNITLTDDNTVVATHKGTEWWDGTLFYQVGTVDPSANTISWGPPVGYDNTVIEADHTTGGSVSAAVVPWPWPGSPFTVIEVVEVHEAGYGGDLWYHVGYIMKGTTPPNTINWGGSTLYRTGGHSYTPSIAFNGNQVIETHAQGSYGSDTRNIEASIGYIDYYSIVFTSSKTVDSGERPRVACNGQMTLAIHEVEDDWSDGFGSQIWWNSGPFN
jgi:hypothetical protein